MQIVAIHKVHVSGAAKILVEAYYKSFIDAKIYLNNKIRTHESFVAIENQRVVGVLNYIRGYSHYANYLEDVVVDKKHRSKGIGTALIKKYIEISKKETPIKQRYALSSTDISNNASIKLHKKTGFKEMGRLKGLHYGKDEIFFAYALR